MFLSDKVRTIDKRSAHSAQTTKKTDTSHPRVGLFCAVDVALEGITQLSFGQFFVRDNEA